MVIPVVVAQEVDQESHVVIWASTLCMKSYYKSHCTAEQTEVEGDGDSMIQSAICFSVINIQYIRYMNVIHTHIYTYTHAHCRSVSVSEVQR